MAIKLRRGLNSDRITITPESGEPLWTTDTKKLYIGDGTTAGGNPVGGGTGDVVGPSSSVDNRVVFFDGTTGKLIKDSGLTLSPAALTRVNDTNVTLTLGGASATSLLAATSLTLGWTGELSTTRGGTGLSALGTSNQLIRVNSAATALEYFTPPYITTAVTSVGITVPSAFSVTPSTITTSGTFAVTGAGSVSQYVRGDGTLAIYNPGTGGGGASVSYYLNGSVTQGTFGGVSMREINKTPIIGTGTDFTISADGYIQSFITDIGDPNQLSIPSGNWNFEMWFSASSVGGSPSFYVELYKWDGTALTSIASSSATPENITGGTSTDLYTTALSVPPTTLALTDRLAIRVYVTHSGRTIKLHTENSHLCQVITTFTTGLTALNGLTEQVQYFSTGTSGTDFAISSTGTTHTFNLPTASATNTGKLSSTNWTNFNTAYTNRITSLTTTGSGAATLVSNVLNIPTPPTATFTSLTVTGSSGSSTLSSGVLNVPTYTLTGLGGQPLATNLTSLAGLSYASASFVKMTGTGVFSLDTNTYLTGNQSIVLSGDVSGSGTTAITTTIGALKVTNAMLAGSIDLTTKVTGLLPDANISSASTWNAKQNALSGTGFVKISGTTISYDNSTYYLASNPSAFIALTALSAGTGISYNNTTGVITSTITQYTDALARASLSFVAGSGAYNSTTGVITIPTNNNQITNGAGFITGNQSITVSGDASGSGTTAITLTLATVTQTSGSSFVKINIDGKGRVTGNTAVASGDITTALGYTPYNSTNPSGYTTNTGTVTTVSVTTANGVSGSVATAGTTPAITITLGAITPTSVNSVVISGSTTPTLAVTGTSSISGSNTGDNAVNSLYSGLVSNATHTGDATGATALTVVGLRGVALPTLGASAGLLKYTGTGTNTWVFDTSTYLTTISGIAAGGDLTGTYASPAIANGVVTLAKMANLATGTILGNNSGSIGVPLALTSADVTAMLSTFSTLTTTKGLVPGSNGVGSTYFLNAAGTWAVPAGGGGGGGITRSVASISTNTTLAAVSNTDYVRLTTASCTVTLPTAVGNTNMYTITRQQSSGDTIINTTSSQTIAGLAGGPATSVNIIMQYASLDLISDGANWNVI